MFEFLRFLFCILVIFSMFPICYLIDVIDLRHKVKRYNKRFNANLNTSFKDMKRLRVQYNDWYLSMFVPYGDDNKSQWERFKEWDGD